MEFEDDKFEGSNSSGLTTFQGNSRAYKHECTSSHRSSNGLTDCSYFDYHCVNVKLLKHYLSKNDTSCGTIHFTMTSRLGNMSNLGEAFTQEILNPCRKIFAIPDRMCYYELINESRKNQKNGKVNICGPNLRCRKINFDQHINQNLTNVIIPSNSINSDENFSEQQLYDERLLKFQRGVRQAKFTSFDTILSSIFTVYESASQETWVYMMYNCTVRSKNVLFLRVLE